MEDKLVQRIKADPDYHTLVSKRSTYGWVLSVVMLVVYYGYILLIAFKRDLLATKIGSGVMTWPPVNAPKEGNTMRCGPTRKQGRRSESRRVLKLPSMTVSPARTTRPPRPPAS